MLPQFIRFNYKITNKFRILSYLCFCSLYLQLLLVLSVTNQSKEQQANHQKSKNSHWNAQKETKNRPAQKTTTPQQHTILTVQYHHQTKHAHHTSVGSTRIYGTGSTQESREQWWSRPARPRISGLWSWKVRRT